MRTRLVHTCWTDPRGRHPWPERATTCLLTMRRSAVPDHHAHVIAQGATDYLVAEYTGLLRAQDSPGKARGAMGLDKTRGVGTGSKSLRWRPYEEVVNELTP